MELVLRNKRYYNMHEIYITDYGEVFLNEVSVKYIWKKISECINGCFFFLNRGCEPGEACTKLYVFVTKPFKWDYVF